MKTLGYYPIPVASRLLDGLTRKEAVDILTALGASARSYGKGETVIQQWEPIKYYYLVVSGEVHSFCAHTNGKRTTTGAFEHGDTFGLVFAFSDMEGQPSSAVCVADSVLIRIPIIDIIHNDTLVATEVRRTYLQNCVNVISQSACMARLRAFVVAQPSIEERVMTYLVEKSKHNHSNEFDIPFDRQELADFIDADRSALSAVLSRMQKRGLISFVKNHFKILKPR